MSVSHTVLLIGDTNTGKTSIVRMYVEGNFTDNHFVTSCPICQNKAFTCPSGPFELEIWDTAGSEDWETMNVSLYSKTDVIIFVVSVDDLDSLNDIIDFWKKKIDTYIDESSYSSFIAVNKIDLPKEEHILTESMVNEKAELVNAHIYNMSAKEGIGINEMFLNVAAVSHNTPIETLKEGDFQVQNSGSFCQCFVF